MINIYEQSVPIFDETEQKQIVKKSTHKISTQATIPKIGVMLVGLGGNNGSTFVAGVLANKKDSHGRPREVSSTQISTDPSPRAPLPTSATSMTRPPTTSKMCTSQSRISCQWPTQSTSKSQVGTSTSATCLTPAREQRFSSQLS